MAGLGKNHRRLEGLIAPGTWNVDPSASPRDIIAKLVGQSADHYVGGGLLDTAKAMNMSPYQILVVGSLVQREAKPHDFAKVARVIYNRLAVPQKLEFDSTVNYLLDRQEIATTDADRAQLTPWNTYAVQGLPATPICSPGEEALTAAERPEPGTGSTSSPWTPRAPPCSPATTSSTWPISSWPSAMACSTRLARPR